MEERLLSKIANFFFYLTIDWEGWTYGISLNEKGETVGRTDLEKGSRGFVLEC